MEWGNLLPWCSLAVLFTGGGTPISADAIRRSPGAAELDTYLLNYGYVDDARQFKHRPREARKTALRNFQDFHGLRVTGRADRATVSLMRKPRCSVPDNGAILPTALSGLGRRMKRAADSPPKSKQTKYGMRWIPKILTWKFSRYSSKLHPSSTWRATRRAFAYWSAPSTLKFRYDHYKPDINFAFYSRQHGDKNDFDGRGKLLAHAFAPGDQDLDGDIHFDADERWVLGPHKDNSRTEFFGIVLHEIGHSLGLSHTKDPTAVMYPMYKGYVKDYNLNRNDVRQLQRLYGKNENYTFPTEKRKTTTATRTTKKPMTPTTSVSYNGGLPKLNCRIHFSDVILGAQYLGYVFSRKEVYKITDKGVVPGWPRATRDVFPRAPSNPDAVVYVREMSRTFFFKGTRLWRYSGYALDPGYPRHVGRILDKPVAAINIKDRKGRSQVYIFGRKYFWQWSHLREKATGPRMLISHYWRGLPRKIHAAVGWRDGYLYFFYANRYYKVSKVTRSVLSGYPKFKGPAWMGRNCGYEPK